jgi:WD40 repeat protein
MKRLILVLLLGTPGAMRSMERVDDLALDGLAKRFLAGKEGELPGPLPANVDRLIAHKLLPNGLAGFILSCVSVPVSNCIGHTAKVNSVKWNSTGDKFVTCSDDNTALLWDAVTGACLYTFKHSRPVTSAVFNQDGDKVITGSDDNRAILWSTLTGACLYEFEHSRPVTSALFNQAGDKVISGSADGTVIVGNAVTGARLYTFSRAGFVTSAIFSQNGDRVIVGFCDADGHRLCVWETETGILLHIHPLKGRFASFSQVGDKVCTLNGPEAMIWDIETGKLLHTLEGHNEQIWSAVFSPAGDMVVTSEGDVAMIWDVETGVLIHTLANDIMGVNGFNSSRDKVVTCSGVDTIMIWKVTTGTLLHTLEGEKSHFNATGDKLVTGSDDPAVRIYDLAPFLSIQKFLQKDICLRQVVALNAIFETMKEQGRVKALGKGAFEEEKLMLQPEEIRFDFNKYPALWDDYVSLPGEIKEVIDPYVTKLSARE